MEIKDYFFESKGKLDLTLDKTYISITAYDVKLPGSKRKKTSTKEKRSLKSTMLLYSFYCLLPVSALIFFVFVLATISIQGLVSRHRVSQLLSHEKPLIGNSSESILDHRSANEGDRFVDGKILAGALDAVNLPGDESLLLVKRSSSNRNNNNTSDDTIHGDNNTTKKDDKTYYFGVVPAKTVEEKAKILPFDEITKRIHKNLGLDWERAWVYIRAPNAHGSIVCKQNVHTRETGEATIKHFIDTTQFL